MPSHVRFVVMCFLCLPLLACAADPDVATPTPLPVTQEPDPEPIPIPGPEEEIIPETVEETLPSHAPADLLGMEPVDIQTLLGSVSLKRWEGEAQVMQFANGQCVMDIYFYEAGPGGAFEASYLSARTLGGADVDTTSCLTSLLPE